MRVCYFGAFKPSYARNDFLRRGLELAGCSLVVCNVPTRWPTYQKYPALVRQYMHVWHRSDVIIVAEFCQTVVPLAWVLGRLTGRPVVFDFVIGLHESVVIERRDYAPHEFGARKLLWLDKTAGELSDLILTGTTPYKEYLAASFGFQLSKVFVAPLGVNDEIFRPLPPSCRSGAELVVLYLGSFIPNHGVDVILGAAAELRSDSRLLFRFVGDGEGKRSAMEMAARLGLSNVEFLPHVPFASVPSYMADADIVLGVFGDTPQAKKAMANKVLQGLAMQKPVVTGDTPAMREHFDHGKHVWLCPLGNPMTLAAALRDMTADEPLRLRLAAQGRQRVLERLTPTVVGQHLRQALDGLIAR